MIGTVPVLINCRDRVSDLLLLICWLERMGVERITLVDNDSSYEPLLEYYERTPHTVLRLPGNFGSKSLWRAGIVPHEPFVFTDPDIIPVEECPADAIAFLWECLCRWPSTKAALGLFLEDTPEFGSKRWERALSTPGLRHSDGRVYCREAGVVERGGVRVRVDYSFSDTSFAVFPADAGFGLAALRSTWPYVARHEPWYRLDAPTEEESYYLARAIQGPLGSSWAEGSQ